MTENLFAYTALRPSYPEYISVNRKANDTIRVTVRSAPSQGAFRACGATADIDLPVEVAREMVYKLIRELRPRAKSQVEIDAYL